MHRKKKKLWTLLGACLLMLAVGVAGARGAIQGQVRTSAPPWLGLFSVSIRPDGAIFIVGSKAMLLVSNDHGKTWIQQTLKERPGSDLFQDRDLYSIRFAPDGKAGWIVGEEGTILHTDDGGESWTRQQSPSTKNLFKVAVADAQNALVAGVDGEIIRTADGGAHWAEIKSPKNISFFDVCFSDKNTAWLAGEFSAILNSTDGGQTWNLAYGGNTGDYTVGPYFSVTFTDPQHGVAAGLSGDIVVTADGGKTWQKQKLPGDIGSYVISMDGSKKKLWISGTGGKMFSQGSDGQWQEVARATFHDLTDIAFAGDQGVAVGLGGTILLTENAGEKWQAVQ